MLGLGVKLLQSLNSFPTGLIDADFTVFPAGDMTATAMRLATGIAFTRASDGFTVQSSDQTLIPSLTGNDRPRICQRTGNSSDRALSFWEQRTNYWTASRSPQGNWPGFFDPMSPPNPDPFVEYDEANQITHSVPTMIGPGGEPSPNKSWWSACLDNDWATSYVDLTASAGSFSFWVKTNGGTYQAWVGWHTSATSDQINASGGTSTTWKKVNLNRIFGGSYFQAMHTEGENFASYGGVANGARAAYLDYLQCEEVGTGTALTHSFCTDAILTTGAGPVTRAGEHIHVPNGQSQIVSGRLNLYVKFRAVAPLAKCYERPAYLWSDPSTGDGVFLIEHNVSRSRHLSIDIGGVTSVFDSGGVIKCDWAAGDIVELFIGVGGGISSKAAQRINGSTVTDMGGAATYGTIALPTQLDLLCKGTAFQLSADVQHITIGSTPGWVP